MSQDSARIVEVSRLRQRRRIDHFASARVQRWYGVDVLTASLAIFGLGEHLRGRAGYATCPLLGLVLPVLLCLVSRDYRARVGGWLITLWERLRAFEAGTGPIPWLAALVFASLPAWLLYLSNQRTRGADDTRPVIPTAVSLLTEGDANLREFFQPGARRDLHEPSGEIRRCFLPVGDGYYSAYPGGMVPFALLTTGAGAILDANLASEAVQIRFEKITAALVGAGCVGLFFLVALTLAPPRPALVSTALVALGSGLFSTVSMALWQHGGIVLGSLLVLLVEFTRERRDVRHGTLIQGIACALMVSCRLTSVSFLVPFAAWVALRQPKRAGAIIAVAATAFLPWAAFYLWVYGSPFGPSTSFLTSSLWRSDLTEPLLGVLVSPGRGLLFYQPWLILAPLALLAKFRGDEPTDPPGWAGFLGTATLAHLLLIAAWGCWWGGWCWGSRLMVDVVPLAGLLCVRPIARLLETRLGVLAIATLAVASILIQVPGVYGDPSTWNASARMPEDLWSWTRAPFLALLR
jgi:hypothetical protein